MLHAMGFSLQANSKVIEGRQHEDRDAQFRYLAGQVAQFSAAGQPVISVDCKKKELVGGFKNTGREYQPVGEPERVNVHDFADKAVGQGHSLRHLRRVRQHRLGHGRYRPRHQCLRGRDIAQLVAHPRQCALSQAPTGC